MPRSVGAGPMVRSIKSVSRIRRFLAAILAWYDRGYYR